jgi:endoglycosylceramidase
MGPFLFSKRKVVFGTKQTIALAVLAVGLFTFARVSGRSAKTPAGAVGFATVSGRRVLGGNGKPLILHGINVANFLKLVPDHTGDLGAADFDTISGWGMNCIRLTIFWDGLEPQPGKINHAYLERIAHLVDLAKARGLYVLLDMHQDLYSAKYADGAPAWATLTDGKPYQPTAMWSDAYLKSEAVHTAIDHFWSNSPGPDGVGLQEHFTRVWRTVAQRFAAEPGVIGFDIINEPAPGKDYVRAMEAEVAAAPEIYAKHNGGKRPDFTLKLGESETRKQMSELFKDASVYMETMDAAAAPFQDFERTRLMPFYTRVAHAIREVDTRHIIFLEPTMLAALGIPTVIEPLKDAKGKRDPQQLYEPHAYDIDVDTGDVTLTNNARIRKILERHEEEAERLNMPLVIGEWGAYGPDPKEAAPASFIVGELNRLGSGDMYWVYERKLANTPLAKVLELRKEK